jgi:hypothetical protein
MAAKKVKPAIKEQQPAEKEQKDLSDKRIRLLHRIGQAIENGTIKTFDSLLDFMGPTPLAETLGYQLKQLETKMEMPEKFNMGDVLTLAEVTRASKEKTVFLFLYFAMGLNKENFEQLHKNNSPGKPSN